MKAILFSLLLGLAGLTSATIVVDAAEWYGALYGDMEVLGIWLSAGLRGILFAALLELLMATMLAVKVDQWSVNILSKTVALFLFAVIGFGTFQGAIEKDRERFYVPEGLRSQIESKKEALERTRDNLEYFRESDQPTNAAISARHQRELQGELSDLMSRLEGGSTSGRLQMWFLFIAKFAVLSANALNFWILGWLYRRGRMEDSMMSRAQLIWRLKQKGITTTELMRQSGLSFKQLNVALKAADVLYKIATQTGNTRYRRRKDKIKRVVKSAHWGLSQLFTDDGVRRENESGRVRSCQYGPRSIPDQGGRESHDEGSE